MKETQSTSLYLYYCLKNLLPRRLTLSIALSLCLRGVTFLLCSSPFTRNFCKILLQRYLIFLQWFKPFDSSSLLFPHRRLYPSTKWHLFVCVWRRRELLAAVVRPRVLAQNENVPYFRRHGNRNFKVFPKVSRERGMLAVISVRPICQLSSGLILTLIIIERLRITGNSDGAPQTAQHHGEISIW